MCGSGHRTVLEHCISDLSKLPKNEDFHSAWGFGGFLAYAVRLRHGASGL